MTPLDPEEISARLSRIALKLSTGKKLNTARISEMDFYKIAGRQRLTDSVYLKISSHLLKQQGLILARAESYFLLVPTSVGEKAPLIDRKSVSYEMRRLAPTTKLVASAVAAKTELSPAAAWPFPKENQQ